MGYTEIMETNTVSVLAFDVGTRNRLIRYDVRDEYLGRAGLSVDRVEAFAFLRRTFIQDQGISKILEAAEANLEVPITFEPPKF